MCVRDLIFSAEKGDPPCIDKDSGINGIRLNLRPKPMSDQEWSKLKKNKPETFSSKIELKREIVYD